MLEKSSCSKPIIVVEHLEEDFTPWILLEYRHLSSIYGSHCVFFTNIPGRYCKLLSKYGRPFTESIVEIVEKGLIEPSELLILDPSSPKPLAYSVLVEKRYVVIGGILGDHPPRGRTRELLTSRLRGVEAFNIGGGQYSIDGAVYYVHYMYTRKGLEGYSYVDGVTIETQNGVIHLPYRYPLVDGRPLISSELVYYLTYRRLPEHVWKELKDNG